MASQRMLLALKFTEVYSMQADPYGINVLHCLGIKSYYYVYTHVSLSINTTMGDDFACLVCTSCGVLRDYWFWLSCCSGLAGISGIWPGTGVLPWWRRG